MCDACFQCAPIGNARGLIKQLTIVSGNIIEQIIAKKRFHRCIVPILAGAIQVFEGNLTIHGSTIHRDDLSGNKGKELDYRRLFLVFLERFF